MHAIVKLADMMHAGFCECARGGERVGGEERVICCVNILKSRLCMRL